MKNNILEMSEEELGRLWEQVDFQEAERKLLQMQQKLTMSTFGGKDELCERLQEEIVRSIHARLLAVRHVSNNTYSAGSDGVLWCSAGDKMRAAMLLNEKASPSTHKRIVQISKGKKYREIQIGTMQERTREKLYAYALSPIAETKGDRKSFAFRKGRSYRDADSYLREALRGVQDSAYILLADVKMYYESINHNWLMEHIPMDKEVLRNFLKTEYMKNGELFQQEVGVSLGSSLSCLLGNMVLDGLQKYIYTGLYGKREIDYQNGNMIRFADDICLLAKSKRDAEKMYKLLQQFLEKRGLTLHSRKTKIQSVREGFDFLAHHYEYANGNVYVTPSEDAVLRIKENLKEYISNYHGSQRRLIETLNQKLTGFASYHKNTHARRVFREIDEIVTKELFKLCMKKHPGWTREKISKTYFYLDDKERYRYTMGGHLYYQVKRLEDTTFVPHNKVGTKFNPYLDQTYLQRREKERSMWNVTGRYQQIWNRQEGKCAICDSLILADQYREVRQKEGTTGNASKNLEYIHKKCKNGNNELQDPFGQMQEDMQRQEKQEGEIQNDEIGKDLLYLLNSGKMPQDAYYELKQFSKYLKEKYGLEIKGYR